MLNLLVDGKGYCHDQILKRYDYLKKKKIIIYLQKKDKEIVLSSDELDVRLLNILLPILNLKHYF